MKKIINCILAVSLLIFAQSCSLQEVNPSSVTSDKYFVTQDSYEELVDETYRYLRPLLQNTSHMWYGTDMYDRTGVVDDTQLPLNDYTTFTGNESQGWWTDNYNLITKANTALTRGAAIKDNIDPKIYATRTGELLALRAYAYFNLVETFGGVPLITSEVTQATYSFTRASEEEVYKQIVGDLNQALAQLPADPSDYGRVAQAMAQHLLGKVLLTRSYKSYAQPADLTSAVSALQVAMSKSTLSTWDALFGDQYAAGNKEVIFAVRYSSTDANNKTGNNLYQQFKFWTDRFPGGALAAPYWRQDASYQPTSYVFNLYAANDYRASERFLQRHIVAAANATGPNGPIKTGDNVIYLPRVAMSPSEITAYEATNKPTYYVVNPDQYHTFFGSNVIYPIIWKFYDPTVVVYTNAGVDPQGHRDTYIFRRAETMLLLAEAYVKQGQGTLATGLINELRQRAKLTGTDLLTGNATISDVLDESARELFGESNRWMDLKRTGTLLTRAAQYNAFTAHNHTGGAIDAKYLLRPIPVTEIVRSPTLTQNPGYPGK